jgi:exosortase family protein XrtF
MISKAKDLFIQNKSGVVFMAKMIAIYSLLTGLYTWVLSPHTAIDRLLIQEIINQGVWVLHTLGYETLQDYTPGLYLMGIVNTSGVIIGGPCDGLSLFILYATFILAFTGKWWMKMLFIGVGIGIIHTLNVLRVVALAVIVLYAPDQLDFHHSYTFTLFVYGVVFAFWMLRIKIYQWIKK